MAINDEVIKLILDIQKSGATPETIKELERLKTKLEDTDVAAKKASGGVAGMGQSLLQTGRVVQDFAQGGLGGILNNIEGLTMALGLGSGLAGLFTVVGVTALVAGPRIKSFFAGLIDGTNAIPPTTDAFKNLNIQIKQHSERLEELSKQQSLTNKELKEFNRLTVESLALDQQSERMKQGIKAHDAGTPHQASRTQIFDQLMGDRSDQAIREIIANVDVRAMSDADIEKQVQEYDRKTYLSGGGKGPGALGRQKDLNTMRQRLRFQRDMERNAGRQRRAEDLFARARKGDQAAITELQTVLPEDSTLREIIRLSSPEEQTAQHAARRFADDQAVAHKKQLDQARAQMQARDEVQEKIKQANAAQKSKILERAEGERGATMIAEQARKDEMQRRLKDDISTMKAADRLREKRLKESAAIMAGRPGLSAEHLAKGDEALRERYVNNLVAQARARFGGTDEQLVRLLENQGALTGNAAFTAERLLRMGRIFRQMQQINNTIAGPW